MWRNKVFNRLREIRGGSLDDARFGTRMTGTGVLAEQVLALFRACCRRCGIRHELPGLEIDGFRWPGGEQMGLFEG